MVLPVRARDATGDPLESAQLLVDGTPSQPVLTKRFSIAGLSAAAYPLRADATFEFLEQDWDDDSEVSTFGAGETVYADARTASTGLASESSSIMRVGQEMQSSPTRYRMQRSLLAFDTSMLGSSASISGATLKLYAIGGSGGSYDIDITEWTDGDDGIGTDDYSAYTSLGSPTVYGSASSSGMSMSAYNSITFSSTSLIDQAGETHIMLRSSDDIAGSAPTTTTETIGFSTYDAGPNQWPKLEISYTLPSTSRHRSVVSRVAGKDFEAPQNASVSGTGVFLETGEFVHSLPLVSIPGRMMSLSAGLTYRSHSTWDGPMGIG